VLIDAPSTLPMVGASASISGLIGFYLLTETKKRIRFFYFFSPFKEFYGEVVLSKWWLVPLCIVGDLVNSFSDLFVEESAMLPSSIATTAHLGGVTFGIATGASILLLSWLRRSKTATNGVLG
jgi:membrane associated rhomboid family serine protease